MNIKHSVAIAAKLLLITLQPVQRVMSQYVPQSQFMAFRILLTYFTMLVNCIIDIVANVGKEAVDTSSNVLIQHLSKGTKNSYEKLQSGKQSPEWDSNLRPSLSQSSKSYHLTANLFIHLPEIKMLFSASYTIFYFILFHLIPFHSILLFSSIFYFI
jgi:hypothetical protein